MADMVLEAAKKAEATEQDGWNWDECDQETPNPTNHRQEEHGEPDLSHKLENVMSFINKWSGENGKGDKEGKGKGKGE